jgi:hypothetical protein
MAVEMLQILNVSAIDSGYESILNNIKENMFNQIEYHKVVENLQFDFSGINNLNKPRMVILFIYYLSYF